MTFEKYLQDYYAKDILSMLCSESPQKDDVSYPETLYPNPASYKDDDVFCMAQKLTIRKLWYRINAAGQGCSGKGYSFDLGFTILIDVEFGIYGENGSLSDPAREIRQYYAECAADIDGAVRNLTVLYLYDRNGKSDLRMRMLRKEGILSDYPVRPLRDEELEERAEMFLQKYYPSALKEPQRLPIADIITEKMGLDLAFDKLDPEGKILGRIYFRECDAEVYSQCGKPVNRHYRAGTLVTDLSIDPERDRGAFRFTMAHEACHWEWDQVLMKLLELLGGCCSLSETCSGDMGNGKKEDDPVDRDINRGNEPPYPVKMFRTLEQNANRTAARILIPKATIREAIRDLMEMQLTPGTRKGRYLEDMICTLSEFYGVSKQAMKIRANELGFIEFTGVLNYMDGHYIPAYSAGGSRQKECRNYLVEADQLVYALSEKPSLLKLYIEGKVVFAEGKLILNDPRYVTEKAGELSLTPYAREHVDECCFLFDLKYHRKKKTIEKRVQEGAQAEDARLEEQEMKMPRQLVPEHKAQTRRTIPLYFNRIDASCYVEAMLRDDAKEQSLEEEARNLDEIEQQFRFILYAKDLVPEALGDAIRYHMKRLHVTVDMLSESTGIDSRTISRYRSGQTIPSLEDLIAVCIGLHLAPQFSLSLLKKARYQLSDSLEDLGYELVLKKYSQNSITECNKILERCGGGHIGKLEKYA